MKKTLSLILGMVLLTLNLPAIAKVQNLSVLLDNVINPDHAPLVIADQQGFFKQQGLKVKFITPNNQKDVTTKIAANKADIGITYQPYLMQEIDRGLPLISIGILIDKPLTSVVALQDSGIKSIPDLKGKRIGTTSSALTGIMLKIMLAKKGLTEKDIEIVNIKHNLMHALLSHQVDAVTGVMRNYEVPHIELHDNNLAALFPEENGIPTYNELIFITNTAHQNDNRFPRFLMAIKQAVAYLDKHPQQTWHKFVKQYPHANNKMYHQAWFATIPYFAEDPSIFNGKDWERFAKFLFKNQMIKKIQPFSRYVIETNSGVVV